MIFDVQQFSQKPSASEKFAPVYVFAGDEETLVQECHHRLKTAFIKRFGDQNPDFNQSKYYGDRDSAEKIVESCQTLPLSSEMKMTTVHRAEKLSDSGQEYISEYCAAPNPSTCLTLLWLARPNETFMRKSLPSVAAKNGVLVKCWKPYEDRRPAWIESKMKEKGKTITRDAAALLSQEGGDSLSELSTELDKLVLFIGERNEAAVQDVKETMSFSRESSPWDFAEHLDKGQFRKAGAILEHCLSQGEEPIRMLNLLANACKRNADSVNGLPEGKEADLFREIKKADLLLKSGHGTESAVFERLLLLCSSGRRGR